MKIVEMEKRVKIDKKQMKSNGIKNGNVYNVNMLKNELVIK